MEIKKYGKTGAVCFLFRCVAIASGCTQSFSGNSSTATSEDSDIARMGAENYRKQDEIGTRSYRTNAFTDDDVAWLIGFSQHGAASPEDAFAVSRCRVRAFLILRGAGLTPKQREMVCQATLTVASGEPRLYAEIDRIAAINVLRKIGDDRAAVYVQPFLKSRDEYTRQFAARTISEFRQ